MTDLQNQNEDGVSEVIGSVLLIALVVLAVAVVAATLFSQPHGAEVPHASIVAGHSNNSSFVLFHEGGDPLTRGKYRIYVDTGTGLEDRTAAFTLTGSDELWSIGEVLTYTGPGTPERVIVLAVDTGGGEVVIAEPSYQRETADTGGQVDAGGSGVVPTVTQTTIPTATPTTIPTTIPTTLPTTPHPATGHDITLITENPKGGVIKGGGSFAFRVTGLWSSIQVGETYRALSPGDQVKITSIRDQKGRIFIGATSITSFEFPDVRVRVNDELLGEGAIDFNKIWITQYDSLASTLVLSVEPKNKWTYFVVDDDIVIGGWKDSREIVLTHLIPDSFGAMNLDLIGISHTDKSVFYNGGAEEYTPPL
ncbi:MAG: type IV pilin [Methanofollis sp.]|uniref:type IV pilin n=1 Tax=Methanofollis sp. TaxID=2052835 RepID=UPI00261B6021|nr:type IV pilin [Methanofollis sp.]MDD4253968.1 type IV pilin [Methanofollis sp.]